jgi:hypothetical protein
MTSFVVNFVCTYVTEILFCKTKLAQAMPGQTQAPAHLETLNTED